MCTKPTLEPDIKMQPQSALTDKNEVFDITIVSNSDGQSNESEPRLVERNLPKAEPNSVECSTAPVPVSSKLKLPSIPLDQLNTFKCSSCQLIFHEKTVHERHILDHYKDGDTRTANPVSSRMHYECRSCPEKFRTFTELASHSDAHTNDEKPFKCFRCHVTFKTEKYRDAHMKNQHTSNPRSSSVIFARQLLSDN